MAEHQLNGTKLEKIPIRFQLGDNVIDGAVVRPLMFQTFAECINDIAAMKAPKTLEGRLRRLRLHRQVAYYINGTVFPVGIDDLTGLPIPDARNLIAKLDENEGQPGKIIRDGDGIDKAITFALGTPISTGQGKASISELEFHANTYGDIEDIMAADTQIAQAQMLIATIAKPLGSTLQQLPSWALAQITVADGVAIQRQVLSRFLGSPDE
jgi:hypothetical protein